MDSLTRLVLHLLVDSSRWCDASTTRDIETITRRVKNEGLSFLTITLPTFCSDFERCLSEEKVDPVAFAGFSRRKALPRLFGGLLDLVFDRQSGLLLDKPCITAIFFIRQITLVCKKVRMSCSLKRDHAAFAGYVQCEKELRAYGKSSYFKDLRKEFRFFAEALWAPLLAGIDYDVYHRNLVPKHGSGAVAERISGNRKYEQKEWPSRLGKSFPIEEFALANFAWFEQLDNISILEPGSERPVRVITVPKTMKAPRIIAIEPMCMQYTQQSLLEILVPALTSLTRGSLNFRSQEKNQKLALESSRSGDFATLDLSEASDRVHSALVFDMLACAPNLRKAAFACRSTRADVPGFGIIPIVKFASMGSALCFPFEAMVFLTIVFKAYVRAKQVGVTEKLIHQFFREVCIYGDDIIIPTDMTSYVTHELTAFGLKVNTRKTFSTGKFRESCGLDAYDGNNIKPVYCRSLPPESRRDASARVSWTSLGNQLYLAGCWESARFVRSQLGLQPVVDEDSSLLGSVTFLPLRSVSRWNKDLHRWETKGEVISVQSPPSLVDGHAALMKFFLKRGDEPHFDKKHLERSGRPDCVRTKIRWASPV